MTTRVPTLISPMVAGFLSLRYFVLFSNITTTDLPSLSLIVTVSLPTVVTVPIKCVALPWASKRPADNKKVNAQTRNLLSMGCLLLLSVLCDFPKLSQQIQPRRPDNYTI